MQSYVTERRKTIYYCFIDPNGICCAYFYVDFGRNHKTLESFWKMVIGGSVLEIGQIKAEDKKQ